ncbi:MAG: hypothetical protein QNJ72_23485 [Pleurocapsa sp. MO_226.B13]|nr:hypothetical protein [Pleurocapsa sp. MO_226.B13]
MNEKYSDCIEKVSQILFETIAKREENLKVKIFEIDTDLLSLLRAIGARVMSRRARSLAPFVGAGSLVNVVDNVDYSSNKSSKKKGWKIQRSPQIKYTTIFGQLKIESPYLCHKKLKTGMRPVAEFLGITHGKHSVALTRSLADFGAEESFHQASLRFQEHYGFKVSSSKLRREVVKVAELSEKFVEEK